MLAIVQIVAPVKVESVVQSSMRKVPILHTSIDVSPVLHSADSSAFPRRASIP
jgi:hypothetical protein